VGLLVLATVPAALVTRAQQVAASLEAEPIGGAGGWPYLAAIPPIEHRRRPMNAKPITTAATAERNSLVALMVVLS